MYTTYAGERVRIRPFSDGAEYWLTVAASLGEPNDHWGPLHWSEPHCMHEFQSAGLLDSGKTSFFAVEQLDTAQVVGWEQHGWLEPNSIHSWVTTDIQRKYWSKGYGMEAKQLILCHLFENYPLETVRAFTLDHHVRAQRGLIACGMHETGRMRGLYYADGVHHDVLVYQVFREEWLEQGFWRTVKRGCDYAPTALV